MAALDAQKRSDDVISKYRKRMDDWSKADKPESPDEFDAIVAELRDDIINAINAAVNEVQVVDAIVAELRDDIINAINAAVNEVQVVADKAVEDAKSKAAKAAPPEPTRARPATTHMPATGHDKPAAHR